MESLAYYRDKLGLTVAFEYGKPTFYVGLCAGWKVTLHLIAADKTPRLPGNGAVRSSSTTSTRCTPTW